MNPENDTAFDRSPGESRRYADPFRFIDAETAMLRRMAMEWKSVQKLRLASQQREANADLIEALQKLEDASRRRLEKALKAHPLWPFLAPLKGLSGASCALVLSYIGNPLRFPGQQCSEGHFLPVGVAEVGAPCPLVLAETVDEGDGRAGEDDFVTDDPRTAEIRFASDGTSGCPGVMLPPRRGTGVRSVWHLLGLHAVHGVSPSRQRGFQSDWNPKARAVLLEPSTGMAAQIVRQRTPKYRDTYDATKERLTSERGDTLRPIQIEGIARKVAVKEFVGDLLIEWKRLSAEITSV